MLKDKVTMSQKKNRKERETFRKTEQKKKWERHYLRKDTKNILKLKYPY